MSSSHHSSSQYQIMRQRRFAPLFWVQFLGAANDNVFKFSLTLLATYSAAQWGGLDPALAGFVIGALFIAPYVLFSATSGQIADKFEKGAFIRRIKEVEILIMMLAAYGFFTQHATVLYVCVFLMGLHSTVFGPVKYSYLPQHLSHEELVGGNGMIEMGTFVSILAGTILGGVLINQFGETGPKVTALVVIVLAVAGRVAAHFIPNSPASDPNLKINWNPFTETWANLKIGARDRAVFNGMLGISWLWFFGTIFLTSFTPLARNVLGANEAVVTLLLATFSVGIGIGSMLCERLSGRMIEIGLVPFGSIGMSVFAIDLYFACEAYGPAGAAPLGVMGFLATAGAWRVLIDLGLLALFGGLYSVPLYALIQQRSDKTHTARIIAANNILNAVFMIVASLMAGVLLKSGLSLPQLFLVTGILNALVAIYIYTLVPEFLLRFCAWLLSHAMYRLKIRNRDAIPIEGPAILACNHVSFVDALLVMAASPRPVVFLMDHSIFKTPLLGWLFRTAKAIPIAPKSEQPGLAAQAYAQAAAVLADGGVIGIFPEGGITRDGELQAFRPGYLRVDEQARALGLAQVPLVPVALEGLWGSFFSRKGGGAMSKPFRRGFWSPVQVICADPVAAQATTPEALQSQITSMLTSAGSAK